MTKLVLLYLTTAFVLHFVSCDAHQSSLSNIGRNYPENGRYQEIVVPKIYHTRRKIELLSTREQVGIHSDEIVIVLNLNGTKKILDLQLNKNLIPQGFLYAHQENGKQKVVEPRFEEINFCHYVGEIRGVPQSWVALSTCDGLSGILYENYRYYEIEKYNNSGYHILSEITTLNYNLQHDMVKPQRNNQIDYLEVNKRTKRSVDTGYDLYYNQPNYLELIIVMDYGVFTQLGYNKDNCTTHASGVANIMHKFYSKVNISVVLVAVEVWSEFDKIKQEANKTLGYFLEYCKKELSQIRAYDSAQLVSYSQTQIGAVGVGYMDAVCSDQSVGINNYQGQRSLALTMAHEIGHNLGLQHDDGNASYVCSCPGEECLMISVRSTIPTDFSNCSIKTLKEQNERGKYYCLKNVPKSQPNFDLKYSVCGNNVIEDGEECDCGDELTCQNSCCNATTCMFTNNSKCAIGNCCDLQTCQMKTQATTCRPAKTECDLPEYCDGATAHCPADTYKLETETCADGGSYCFHGICLATDGVKVRRYFGIGYNKNEECYAIDINKVNNNLDCNRMYGVSDFYNNGKRVTLQTCKDINYSRLKFNEQNYVSITRTFSKNYTFVACHLIMVGYDNFGPNVTLCDNSGQVTCTTFSKQRSLIPKCPQSCNDHGWCNNKGECHCENIFEPPDCSAIGYGGSISSGYARNPYAFIIARNVMLIFFLGVMPLVLLLAYCNFQIRPYINTKKRSIRVRGYIQRFARGVSRRFTLPKNTNMPKSTKPVEASTNSTTATTNNTSTEVASVEAICKPVGFTLTPIVPDNKEPPAQAINSYANVNMLMYNKCQDEIYSIPDVGFSNRNWNAPNENTSAPVYDIVKPNRPVTQYYEQHPSIYENLQNIDKQNTEKPVIQPKPVLPKVSPNAKHKTGDLTIRENLEKIFGGKVGGNQKPLVMKKPNIVKDNSTILVHNTVNGVDKIDKIEDSSENMSVKDIIRQMNETSH